jgi:hypothetical protein
MARIWAVWAVRTASQRVRGIGLGRCGAYLARPEGEKEGAGGVLLARAIWQEGVGGRGGVDDDSEGVEGGGELNGEDGGRLGELERG